MSNKNTSHNNWTHPNAMLRPNSQFNEPRQFSPQQWTFGAYQGMGHSNTQSEGFDSSQMPSQPSLSPFTPQMPFSYPQTNFLPQFNQMTHSMGAQNQNYHFWNNNYDNFQSQMVQNNNTFIPQIYDPQIMSPQPSQSQRFHKNDYPKESHNSNDSRKSNYNRRSPMRNDSRSFKSNSKSNRNYDDRKRNFNDDDDSRKRHDRDKRRYNPYNKDNSNNRNETKNESKRNSSSNGPNNERENRENNSDVKTETKTSRKEMSIDVEEVVTKPVKWFRCSPADLYYEPKRHNSEFTTGTDRLKELKNKFRADLVERASRVKASKTPFEFPPRKIKLRPPKLQQSESDGTSCSDSASDSDDCEDSAYEELQRKKTHPWRLHDELWYNDPGEMNDGPLCRCSLKARRSGIRHGIYPGEDHINPCDPNSNNRDGLFHYRISISPHTNFFLKFPTVIPHDGHDFIFEGYSLLSHFPLTNLPPCKVIRFNIEYTINFEEEKFPTNFTVEESDLITSFVFNELLELVDLNWKAHGDDGCPRFHFFPRFSRLLDDDGKELLSLNVVLQYLININRLIIDPEKLSEYKSMPNDVWLEYAKQLKGMIVTYPGMKPSSLRVDQIDRETDEKVDGTKSDASNLDNQYPVIVHFGIRPPQLSYAGNPKYQKAWRDYVKFRHLLANKPKVSFVDRQTLLQKEEKLQEMRMKSDLKRDVTVVISSKGFYSTGFHCDVVQHSLIVPVLVCHLRFHQSLQYLERIIGYDFNERYLLQLALTHPSYRENFGTNPDHTRNALTNCGIRQPQYGDRRVHFLNTRKRGINMLITIMSRFGCREETTSNINHNERLEFLGDAVVEFLSSIHLYFMFPELEEGGLATYRAAIVQNQHLAVLAKKLQLDKFMLYAHGSDLCHDLELRHAMANCFEALMGSLFLDGGIEVADRIFSNTLFNDNPVLLDVWVNYPPHPIQQQELNGDRHYIDLIPRLKELKKFEDVTGIEFTHIRLLARAFTHRSVGYNNLTLGSNQRMEFLGDTVLQLVASEYLYKFFPEHHEGHLSLLRSSLVNNKTQAVVCDDLGMTQIAIYNYAKGEMKTKDRADLLEAFLGALYVDKGLTFCKVFCEVCFFPRLEDFIMNQDWNDPKSKLQQCCLTLRSVDGGEPDIPIYKVIESKGPTNTRVYVVAVYFRDQRLSTGEGHSIQEAEMNAALNALESSKQLFPQLNHQRKVIEKSVKIVKHKISSNSEKRKKSHHKSTHK